MTASAIYAGTVRHRRLAHPADEFRHRIALAYLDLDELPHLLGGRLVRRRPGVVRVRCRDLLGGRAGLRDLGDAVREVIEARSGRPAPTGPMRVLTHPRTLGACFNPLSLYYAFDADERLDAVVGEVTNTPWGERHAYVLRAGDGNAGSLRGAHPKALHVSPLLPMERVHHWAVSAPGDTLSVHVANRPADGGAADFDATLNLRREPLTRRSLASLALTGGALRTLGLIYTHALALRLRGAAHVPHPGPRAEAR
jgi:uncharacterized protein